MSQNSSTLKGVGIAMILYGAVYAILGTMTAFGLVEGLLPGMEGAEIGLMILSYVVAIVAIVCGASAIRGAVALAYKLGMVFIVLGIISMVFYRISQGGFDVFGFIAMALGLAMFSGARKR